MRHDAVSVKFDSAGNALVNKSIGVIILVSLRRAAVNIYNRRTRQKRVPSNLTDSLDELDFLIAHEDRVDSELESKQLAKVISDFVRSLPERGRYIFMSRYYAAEPIGKIASALRVSRSTVNKEIAAIKHGLRQKLESEGYYI